MHSSFSRGVIIPFALNTWQHLYNSFEEVPGVFKLATAITSNDLEEIQKFLDTAVNSR